MNDETECAIVDPSSTQEFHLPKGTSIFQAEKALNIIKSLHASKAATITDSLSSMMTLQDSFNISPVTIEIFNLISSMDTQIEMKWQMNKQRKQLVNPKL